jgi:hypothetical protein
MPRLSSIRRLLARILSALDGHYFFLLPPYFLSTVTRRNVAGMDVPS